MEKILLIGADSTLLPSRAALLARLGITVECADVRELDHHLQDGELSLVVLCHTLHKDERCSITELVHNQSPHMKVLQIMAGMDSDGRNDCGADATSSAQPAELIRAARKLVSPTSPIH